MDVLTKMKQYNLTSKSLIYILAVWIASNLISQFLYIVSHGSPYDGLVLLQSLGPIYYLIVIIELLLWAFAFIFISRNAIKLVNSNKEELIISGQC